jgi:hypothetical protein
MSMRHFQKASASSYLGLPVRLESVGFPHHQAADMSDAIVEALALLVRVRR